MACINGCTLVDIAGETDDCNDHDRHCSGNDDDGDSSGSDDVALYLETLQCHVSGTIWRCLPEHELSSLPYEYDDAAQAAPVGGDALACETLTEGQASAGGGTGIAAPLWTGHARHVAIATAADEDMNRAQDWDLTSSQAKGALTDGMAADAPQRSGEATSDLRNGEGGEGARQPPLSEANDRGGTPVFANCDSISNPEDHRLAERTFDLLQKPIHRSEYRRRQTARKELLNSRSLARALCLRCGTASCCSGCNGCSNDDVVASAGAMPPPPSPKPDCQLQAAPSAVPPGVAFKMASDDDIQWDSAGTKRRRVVIVGDGKDDNIPPPSAVKDSGGRVADLGTGLPGDVGDCRWCTISTDLGSGHGESMMAGAEGEVAKPRIENLRTLPECGWGDTTPAANELLYRLAREMGLESPRVTPGLYVVLPVQTRGGKWTWRVEQLKKNHPALAEEVRRWHIPHRMSVVQITDPCHPVYNNDIMLRNCETKQRMLVFTEDLDANTPLSAYFGTIKTQAESDEYVLADMTHGRQLMEAYTHTCEWTELHENDSEKLVMVGDTSSCIMTYANEIRFWGSCDEQWRDVSLVAEDIRRTGCRCDGYKGRTANAECVQGIAKYQDRLGKICYGFFILYYTSRHVQRGEEALIHWDTTGSFFNVIREATNTNRFYKGLQSRLRSREEQLAASLARLGTAEIEIRRLSELVWQKDEHVERMQSELAALNAWAGPRLEVAASGLEATPPPLPHGLSYACLLDKLGKLRDEVSALRSERQAGLEATIRVSSQALQLEQLRNNLEEERAAREEVERQLAACRATSNLRLVQLDGCRNQLKDLKAELAAATRKQGRGGAGRGGTDRRRRGTAATAAAGLAATAAATTVAWAAMDSCTLLGYAGPGSLCGGTGTSGGEAGCVPSALDLDQGTWGRPDFGCQWQGQERGREEGTADGGLHQAGGARAPWGVSAGGLLPPRQRDGDGGDAAEVEPVPWPEAVKVELNREYSGGDRAGPGRQCLPERIRGVFTGGGSICKTGPAGPLRAAASLRRAAIKVVKQAEVVDLTSDE